MTRIVVKEILDRAKPHQSRPTGPKAPRLRLFGWYTSKGKCLEGHGTEPQVQIATDLSGLSNFDDPQLHAALRELSVADAVEK
jgi:hypothetical protein